MNSHEKELLEFARRWEPFGGPSAADILVEFGMTPRRFSERLEEAITRITQTPSFHVTDAPAPGSRSAVTTSKHAQKDGMS